MVVERRDTNGGSGSAGPPLGNVRQYAGLAILVGVGLVGLVLLGASADAPWEWWATAAFAGLGIAGAAGHLLLVELPWRRSAVELANLERRHARECGALTAALSELHHGDLVEATAPLSALDPDMRRVVEVATGALGSLIEQIQMASVEVATSANGVRETSADLATGSSQQASAVVDITASMERLAHSAGEIAGNAARQADLAARAEEGGDAGVAALDAAVAGSEAVLQRIGVIAERADSLGGRAREIYRVLDLITEIARETHILSLNAAIEAAAAGGHGERFSAVAEEVRRLAERSRESVDEVRSLLDEFSGAIRAVDVATQEGSRAADDVLVRSRSTQGAIAQLREALADTARAARDISLATEEQRGSSDQVVVTLRAVRGVVQRTADGLQRFQGAAAKLNQLALSIQLLSQSFRLESRHSLKHLASRWARRLVNHVGNQEAVEVMLSDLLRELPYVEAAYFVEASGAMVAVAANRDLVGDRDLGEAMQAGKMYADRPWFQAVAREGRPVVTSLYESLLTGQQCFTIAAAVQEASLRGILGMDVNARNWTRI